MKKLLILLVTALILFLGMLHLAKAAEILSTTYWSGWNDYTSGVDGLELKNAGYPQFGQGQTVTQDTYSIYYPTPTEMRQMAQSATGQRVTIYGVDRGTSYTFRAVSGSYTGKDGLTPSQALNNLLLRIKNVPYYTTGGQILWFLY